MNGTHGEVQRDRAGSTEVRELEVHTELPAPSRSRTELRTGMGQPTDRPRRSKLGAGNDPERQLRRDARVAVEEERGWVTRPLPIASRWASWRRPPSASSSAWEASTRPHQPSEVASRNAHCAAREVRDSATASRLNDDPELTRQDLGADVGTQARHAKRGLPLGGRVAQIEVTPHLRHRAPAVYRDACRQRNQRPQRREIGDTNVRSLHLDAPEHPRGCHDSPGRAGDHLRCDQVQAARFEGDVSQLDATPGQVELSVAQGCGKRHLGSDASCDVHASSRVLDTAIRRRGTDSSPRAERARQRAFKVSAQSGGRQRADCRGAGASSSRDPVTDRVGVRAREIERASRCPRRGPTAGDDATVAGRRLAPLQHEETRPARREDRGRGALRHRARHRPTRAARTRSHGEGETHRMRGRRGGGFYLQLRPAPEMTPWSISASSAKGASTGETWHVVLLSGGGRRIVDSCSVPDAGPASDT